MADPNLVLGSSLLWDYSTDSGATWKTVVCQKNATWSSSRNISTDETNCGTFKAAGPTNDSLNFSGLVDTAPDAAEGSWTELQTLYRANTKFTSKFYVGSEPWLSAEGYLTKLDLVNEGPSANVSFNATFEVTGTVDITP